jgi:hypothetical protein
MIAALWGFTDAAQFSRALPPPTAPALVPIAVTITSIASSHNPWLARIANMLALKTMRPVSAPWFDRLGRCCSEHRASMPFTRTAATSRCAFVTVSAKRHSTRKGDPMLSRSVTVTVTLAVAALGLVALPATPAHAGDCDSWYEPCGEVENNSGRSVTITREWGTTDAQRWNASAVLANGQRAGGGTDDIDGFYVNARCRVWANMQGPGADYWAYGPRWHKVGSGTTAKLSRYICE